MCHNYNIFGTIEVMKRIVFEHIPAWLLLAVFGFIVLHAPITVFVSTHWPEVALYVKAWKELFILIAGLLIFAGCIASGYWRKIIKDRVLWAAGAFIAVHLGVLVISDGSWQSIVAGLMIDLRYVAYFVVVYIFIRQFPAYQSIFLRVGIVGAAIVIGFALLQLLLPHDFLKYLGYGPETIQPYLTVDKNYDFIRYISTLRGPNPLGAFAAMVVTAVVAFVAMRKVPELQTNRSKLLFALFAIGGPIALWVSYSRGAILGAIVSITIALLVVYWRKVSLRMWLGVVGVLVVGILVVYAIRDTTFFHNVVLHNNPTTGAEIDSNQGHIDSVETGIARTFHEPFGAGIGSTGSASLFGDDPIIIENQFLFIAHESGWLGLLLFGILIGLIFVKLWQRRSDWRALAVLASGIGMLVIGVFLPVWVDDTVSIVWWGFAAVLLAGERSIKHARTTNKKAKRTT